MLDAQEYTLIGPPSIHRFTLSFTRYQQPPQSRPATSPKTQLSLLFLHAVGSHKESWIPTIEHIFELQDATLNDSFYVLEAWVMDSPNHGRSAKLNDEKIHLIPEGLTGKQWAAATQTLFTSGLLQGTHTVGIGHSAGSCIIVEATEGYPLHRLPFSSIILVEPGMLPADVLERALQNKATDPLFRIVEMTRTRKDIWPSRADARTWLAKRLPWRRWDKRALDLYVENGLRDLPTYNYPDKSGVTLATGREQETWGYMYHDDGLWALNKLSELCPVIPVHTIFGAQVDMISPEVQAALVSEKDGRKMKSVVRVAKAGHLVVQENPKGVAVAVWDTLIGDYGKLTLSSRL